MYTVLYILGHLNVNILLIKTHKILMVDYIKYSTKKYHILCHVQHIFVYASLGMQYKNNIQYIITCKVHMHDTLQQYITTEKIKEDNFFYMCVVQYLK